MMTIRQMRNAAGLSVPQLLKDCPFKITEPILSYIENGRVNPTQEFYDWVALKCGCGLQTTDARQNIGVITPETCRADAYKGMDRLSRQRAILNVLGRREMTAREIAYALGFKERNAAAPRLHELLHEAEPRIEVVGKRIDSVTGKRVSVYRRIDIERINAQ